MKRVYLMYLGNCMELPDGPSLIGRSLTCRMRFNDDAVSRKHLLIQCHDGTVTAEDLRSKNGSKLNAVPIDGLVQVEDGDTLEIGSRQLKILIVEDEQTSDSPTVPDFPSIPMPEVAPPPAPDDVLEASQRCPKCRVAVEEADECRNCGYSWASFKTRAVTQEVAVLPEALEQHERRLHARHGVETRVLYASENLTIESIAINLSRSGMFLQTEILDQVDTPCTITLMVDGAPAISLKGHVRRVVEKKGDESLGLGIEFAKLSPSALRWLDDSIARLASG